MFHLCPTCAKTVEDIKKSTSLSQVQIRVIKYSRKEEQNKKTKNPEIPEMFVGNTEKQHLEEMKASYKISTTVQVSVNKILR